jgi:hypothetical protein
MQPRSAEAVMTMYDSLDHVRERQQEVQTMAAEQRHGQRLRRLTKATRRSERAERQLSRSWSEAARLRAELTRLASDQWR